MAELPCVAPHPSADTRDLCTFFRSEKLVCLSRVLSAWGCSSCAIKADSQPAPFYSRGSGSWLRWGWVVQQKSVDSWAWTCVQREVCLQISWEGKCSCLWLKMKFLLNCSTYLMWRDRGSGITLLTNGITVQTLSSLCMWTRGNVCLCLCSVWYFVLHFRLQLVSVWNKLYVDGCVTGSWMSSTTQADIGSVEHNSFCKYLFFKL